MGQAFSAKDFRTWSGTVLAARALHEMAALPGQPSGDPAVLRAVETVARALGNTRTVCRRCYVHPAVIDAYLDGSLARTLEGRVSRRLQGARAPRRLETAVLALLQRRLRRDARRRPARAGRGGMIGAPTRLISVTSGSSSTQNFQRCSGLPCGGDVELHRGDAGGEEQPERAAAVQRFADRRRHDLVDLHGHLIAGDVEHPAVYGGPLPLGDERDVPGLAIEGRHATWRSPLRESISPPLDLLRSRYQRKMTPSEPRQKLKPPRSRSMSSPTSESWTLRK